MLAMAINPESPAQEKPPAGGSASDGKHGRGEPRRAGHGLLTTLCGLFGAAAMWVLQTEIGEALAAQACYPRRTPLAAPQWPWLMPTLSAVSVGALLIGIVGAGIAWRNWRMACEAYSGSAHSVADTSRGRVRFLAMAGLMLSLLFLVGLVASGFAVLLVSPCSAWR
jgi:hypothetical protein